MRSKGIWNDLELQRKKLETMYI